MKTGESRRRRCQECIIIISCVSQDAISPVIIDGLKWLYLCYFKRGMVIEVWTDAYLPMTINPFLRHALLFVSRES